MVDNRTASNSKAIDCVPDATKRHKKPGEQTSCPLTGLIKHDSTLPSKRGRIEKG
jgi:hypothetical protein